MTQLNFSFPPPPSPHPTYTHTHTLSLSLSLSLSLTLILILFFSLVSNISTSIYPCLIFLCLFFPLYHISLSSPPSLASMDGWAPLGWICSRLCQWPRGLPCGWAGHCRRCRWRESGVWHYCPHHYGGTCA